MKFLPIERFGEKVYAGFWTRVGAAIIDTLLIISFMAILLFLQSSSLTIEMITRIILGFLFSIYTIYFHYKFGATLGKMATGIKVTLPNGDPLGLKEALLRSSVDLGFVFLAVIADFIAISNADPDQFMNAGWIERSDYIYSLLPAWSKILSTCSHLWFWSECIVLLFNKRKRAIHDFIAGTVVIHKEHAKKSAKQDAMTKHLLARRQGN